MFHWICPECGQEIAPGVKECPVCEPQASALPLPSSAPAVAATPAPEAARPVVAKPPAPEPRVATQLEIVTPPEVVLQPEVILQPQVVMRTPVVAPEKSKPPVILEALPVGAPPVVLPVVPADVSPTTPPEPETFADRLADLAERLHGERVPFTAPRVFQESAAPGPRVERAEKAGERTPVVLDVTFEVTPAQTLLASPPSVRLLAEPQPPAIAGAIPLDQVFDARPAEHAASSRGLTGPEPAALSPVRLPDPPPREIAPGLAPLQDYYDAANRQMRFVEYASTIASSKVLPSTTLPGPALPRELMSLQAAGLVPIGVSRRQAAFVGRYPWMTKYVVTGILLTAGVATYSMLPGSSSSAPPRPTPEPAPEPPISVRSTRPANSLARFVEVTGIRFMEVNKKPQIHYLVVNHSSAPLGSVMVYVTLRAIHAKPGQPPIARLTFRSPALEAFEAKEMFSSIEKAAGPLDLPDWQDLHTEVEVQ